MGLVGRFRIAFALVTAVVLGLLARILPWAGRRLVEIRVERRFNVVLRHGPYRATPRAVELHRSLLVADLHADSLLYGRDLVSRSSVGHVDIPRLIEGGVTLQALSACVRVASHLNVERNEDTTDDVRLLAIALGWPPATWTSGLARALYIAARARTFAARSDGRFTIIDSADGLAGYLERRNAHPAISAGFLTIEGAAALDGDMDNVDRLAAAGFRLFGLTHMVDNAFAGSSTGVVKGGLTPAGRALVARLEAASLLVDVAHASTATIDDVLAVATRPVVASHTGLDGVYPSPRNLSDEHVRAVAATGGVVGIGFWPAVTGGDDPGAIARSIVHAVRVGGVDHVALGSDFDGAVATPFDASGMPLLTDALLAEGFADDDVGRVMGGNVVRLLEAWLPA